MNPILFQLIASLIHIAGVYAARESILIFNRHRCGYSWQKLGT